MGGMLLQHTWSGCATSAKTASTMGTSILYFCGCRASSMMGMTLGRFLAMFTKSLPAEDCAESKQRQGVYEVPSKREASVATYGHRTVNNFCTVLEQ